MDTKKALKELGLKLIQLESKDDDAIPGQAELLSSLEAEQSVLKDEIAKELDRIQNDKSKVKSSSKSSISSLTSFAKKFSSKSVSDIDPLTLINENRERIQELQGLISDATYPVGSVSL